MYTVEYRKKDVAVMKNGKPVLLLEKGMAVEKRTKNGELRQYLIKNFIKERDQVVLDDVRYNFDFATRIINLCTNGYKVVAKENITPKKRGKEKEYLSPEVKTIIAKKTTITGFAKTTNLNLSYLFRLLNQDLSVGPGTKQKILRGFSSFGIDDSNLFTSKV
jgi:hypothetical protein